MNATIHFDLDGTLVTEDGSPYPLADAVEEFDVAVDDERLADFRGLAVQYFQRSVAEPYRRAAAVWGDHHGLDVDPEAVAATIRRRQVERSVLVEGAVETLSALGDESEFSLAMITNGAGEVQRGKLRRHGLDDHFEEVVVSGETAYMKPDDGIFELAAERSRADAHAYVADRLAYDVVPARENGFAGVWVGDRETPVADLTVESVTELTAEDLHRVLDQR